MHVHAYGCCSLQGAGAEAKNAMAIAPSSLTPTMAMALPPRKPLPLLLLSLSFPVLLLLLSFVLLLSHNTFSLLLCPLIPKAASRPNANVITTAAAPTLDAAMDKTLRAFHASSPPPTLPPPPPPPPPPPAAAVVSPPVKSNKKVSMKRNKSILKLLLRQTPRTRRFAERAAELFASPRPCENRFFMTWLSPLAQFGRRELLVMESLFRSHRDACLLIASDTMDSEGGSDRLRPFLERGLRVAAASPDLAYLLNGTPAEAWLGTVQSGDVSPGSVPVGQNLSNLLRLALLYKYGGVYLDADVVVLRSFSDLRNTIGAQAVDAATGDWMRLNNAVMVFDRGHPLLREFIAEFATKFDGSKWGHNGPYLVSRVAARWRHRRPEADLTVLPPAAFYPVDWNKIGGLFLAPKDRKEERWVKAKVEIIKGESFGIHLWNRESKNLEMEQGSVIGRLLSDSCLFCNSSMFAKHE
ncbi:hypothetical protein GUJ93_ZPchr0014g46775 [Zizania palustris]|uniref:Alpha 1,4-glycosyltransferase domain-containing protein n=1 Tax=Zizania palustris TaxID=103762 RepID=A0A8J5W5V5_ZIZPA|nr:hypothetical protein GUJ93_ZPchr0014g46775 [Zizania palustris]